MNEEKDFLGKEPVGKLLLRLALPTVTAQIINMLYNIVDRMYIGHIPNIGDTALTGVGVCMPLIMIVSAFSAFAAYGRCSSCFHFYGTGKSRCGRKHIGKLFCHTAYHLCFIDCNPSDLEPRLSHGIWRQ